MSVLFQKVRELFSIDFRSLAVFRVALGGLVLADVARRSFDLTAFYTDWGVLPRSVAMGGDLGSPYQWSFYLANGQAWFAALLLVLTALGALAMVLGYRTRLATVLCWVLIISVQNRNPLILSGADTVLRLLLFWAMFLPLGARWALDQWHRPAEPRETPPTGVCSVATVAVLMQVVYIYVFSALLKQSPIWIPEGTALYFAFSHQFFASPLATWLLQYPDLLKAMTYATFYSELFGPLLAFVPVLTGPLRTLTALYFMAFHLIGIGLTLYVGLFIWVCAVAWLLFLPTWFWEKLLPALGRTPVVTYLVQFGESLSENVTQAARWIDRGVRAVDPYTTRTLADRFPPGVERLLRSLVECAVILLFVYVTLWNLRTVEFAHNRQNPRDLRTFWQNTFPTKYNGLGQALSISQHWNMFSPHPDKTSGYFVITGKTFLGDTVHPFERVATQQAEGLPVPAHAFPNEQWRKYLDKISQKKYEKYRLYFGRYLTRLYNQHRPLDEAMKSFSIEYVETYAAPPGGQPATHALNIWQHECYTKREQARIRNRLQGVLKERARSGL